MQVTRKSPWSGISHTMEIDVTVKQILAWKSGALIQNAMPQLTADEREFIMTGIMPEEWKKSSKMIKRALEFATEAHEEQVRNYTEEPYIEHPRRVAETISKIGGNKFMVATALLHDVIEDCNVTHKELRQIFSVYIANMVWDLTDQANITWNRSQRKSWEAGRLHMCSYEVQTIKVADLMDNTESIVKHDKDFAKVYLPEKHMLLMSLTKADPKLRKLAFSQVTYAWRELGD